ncbi:hypothetical protein HDU76_011798 [Blyttiomyces sp. JEL0837]|nr:hypothetical protein HDU76_011798 [Blyttiomyces sp. JEL0837]
MTAPSSKPTGQKASRGGYRFIDGVYKYTRVFDEGEEKNHNNNRGDDERSPLINSPALRSSLYRSTESCNSRNSDNRNLEPLSTRSSTTVVSRSTRASRSDYNNGGSGGGGADDISIMIDPPSPPSNAPEDRLKSKIEEVHGLVGRVMGKILNRGEKIDHLRERAAKLDGVTNLFRRRGQEVEAESWLKSYKVHTFCGVVFTTVIIAAIAILIIIFAIAITNLVTPPIRPPVPGAPIPPGQPQYPYPPPQYPYPYPPYPYPPYCPPYPGQPVPPGQQPPPPVPPPTQQPPPPPAPTH